MSALTHLLTNSLTHSLLSAFCLLLCAVATHAASLTPVELSCEHGVDPLGVDVPSPRLSWKLDGDGRAQRQTAWQILAASTSAKLNREDGDLWDSGKVTSDESLFIPYAGQLLNSSQRVFWKVRTWDEANRPSAWSKPTTWTMGLLKDSDWGARWIRASDTNAQSILLRREFDVKRGLRRALVHVCGLGQYELTVNGRKASNDLMTPGWSQYDKTCLYDTYDVTTLLQRGDNGLGMILGNGMYNVRSSNRYKKFKGSFGPLKAIAQLRLEYADGSVEIIGTDSQWRVGPSPITFSCVYGGEDYDARLEQKGWDSPREVTERRSGRSSVERGISRGEAGFDDSAWKPAVETSGPGGKLRSFTAAAPPFTRFEVLKPVGSREITNGVTVHDLGQNASVMVSLRVKGPAGSSVRVIPAELVKADGTVERTSSGRGDAWWQYTLAGRGREEYFSRFFYHGSRYCQVELMPATENGELPVVEFIEGVVVHSAAPATGEFECSNNLFNRIHKLVRWAQRSNLASVLTDCPHRERLGWLEQYHLNGPSLRYEFDLNRMFTKGMNDMADTQMPNGFVPNIAPEYTVFGKGKDDFSNAYRNSPEWGSAFLIVPWQQYEFTGDLELLRRHYDVMKRYVFYLGSTATNHIVSHGLGDWYDIGPKAPGFSQLTPKALTATALYYQDVKILSQAATLLNKTADAREFAALAKEIAAAFNREFFDPEKRVYATGSQCANAIPLVTGLCDYTNRQAVLDAVVADVCKTGLTAGDVGYRYLLRALAEGGRSDVVFEMINQSEKPGYGYQLKMGATSLTEAWNARRTSSQNHFMLGQIMEWFYHDLAGIATDISKPGFKRTIIKPQPVGDVTWVRAGYDSVRGRISVHWECSKESFKLGVKIPANTTALVHLPAKDAAQVTEGGRRAESRPGVTFLRMEDGAALYEVLSGDYTFESLLN